MSRWWAYAPRRDSEAEWQHVERNRRRALIAQTLEAAKSAGAELITEAPMAGFASKAHSRDGKYYPCRDVTNGARPAWLWGGVM